MKKSDELSKPDSCLNRAYPSELLFVLLARDPAAPIAIRAWLTERIRLGKNKIGDPQIVEALRLAEQMEQQRTMQELFEGRPPDVPSVLAVATTPVVTVHQPQPEPNKPKYCQSIYPPSHQPPFVELVKCGKVVDEHGQHRDGSRGHYINGYKWD